LQSVNPQRVNLLSNQQSQINQNKQKGSILGAVSSQNQQLKISKKAKVNNLYSFN